MPNSMVLFFTFFLVSLFSTFPLFTQATSTVAKDQVPCTMCAECENPCQPLPSPPPPVIECPPPPPPPSPPPPPAVVECPPPPKPKCPGECEPLPPPAPSCTGNCEKPPTLPETPCQDGACLPSQVPPMPWMPPGPPRPSYPPPAYPYVPPGTPLPGQETDQDNNDGPKLNPFPVLRLSNLYYFTMHSLISVALLPLPYYLFI